MFVIQNKINQKKGGLKDKIHINLKLRTIYFLAETFISCQKFPETLNNPDIILEIKTKFWIM